MKKLSPFSGLTRRQLLQNAACGFGGLALQAMTSNLARAATPLDARPPHFLPRAKRMIFLFMAGGPSQEDLFDPKPEIAKNHGKTVSAKVDDQQIRVGVEKFIAMKPAAPVRPHGESVSTTSNSRIATPAPISG